MECLAGLVRISLHAVDPRHLLQTTDRMADTQARLGLFALEVRKSHVGAVPQSTSMGLLFVLFLTLTRDRSLTT